LREPLPEEYEMKETFEEDGSIKIEKIGPITRPWTADAAGEAGHTCRVCEAAIDCAYLHTVVKFPEAASQEETDEYKLRKKKKAQLRFEEEIK
jgi:hypothetical protein